MDENLLGKEGAVIANCDANYEVPAWKRCSAECLRKFLPNPACYVFTRRASLSLIDHGLAKSDACAPLSADIGLCIFCWLLLCRLRRNALLVNMQICTAAAVT